MRFDVLTLFPEMFASPLEGSILGRAREKGLISVTLHQIRDWTTDKHNTADDNPYGGGGGMVMKADVVIHAVRGVREKMDRDQDRDQDAPVIYLSPQGEPLTSELAGELAETPAVILLCGSYEGIDERAIDAVVDREISIGDYVVTGGELAALVLINAVARKVPGVLGNESSAERESFEDGLLDFPHYTRPEDFEGQGVPEVLLSGHHANIARWRRREAIRRTALRRPDLLRTADLTDEERRWIAEELKPRMDSE